MADGQQLLFDPVAEDGITLLCYDLSGRLVDRIENVSLGDRVEAHAAGRESLHSACLWGWLAAKRAQEQHPAPPMTREQWYALLDAHYHDSTNL